MRRSTLGCTFTLGLLLGVSGPARAVASATTVDEAPQLPLRFEANAGQTDPAVRYLARGRGYTAFLTDDGATLRLFGTDHDTALRIRPLAPQRSRRWQEQARGDDHPAATYYASVQETRASLAVRDYPDVRQLGVWCGIDLRWHASADGALEYDLEIAAGADPAQARFELDGADRLAIDDAGNLRIEAGGHHLQQPAPIAWQLDASGQREPVEVRYQLAGKSRYQLAVARYDNSRPLLIDPALLYGTYLGGSSGVADGTAINAVTVNAAGEVFVAGTTYAADFPVNAGDQSHGSHSDAFVAKFATNGSRIWATFLGDSGVGQQTYELGTAIAVSADSTRIYLAGSIGLGLDPIEYKHNVFVAPINNPSGSTITFLQPDVFGGNAAPSPVVDGDEKPTAIAIDAAGNITIVGRTTSPDFPITTNAIDPVFAGSNGGGDGFLRRYNSSFGLTTSSYYGFAQGDDIVNALAVGPDQSLTLVGTFYFSPTSSQIYVSRLNNAATAPVWFLTANGDALDLPTDIKVGPGGRTFIVGSTNSTDFASGTSPPPLQPTFGGALDAFLMVVKADGSDLDTATYLGTSTIEIATGLYLAGNGEVRISGTRSSPPLMDTDDIFVTSLNATLTGVSRPTVYLGASGVSDFGDAIAVAPDGSYWVAGRSGGNVRVTSDAFQPVRPGSDVNGVLLHLREANPVISVADLTIAEGNSSGATAVFRVRLDALNTGTVTVAYTTANGTATAPADYTATTGTLTFDTNSNSLERVVNVPIAGDTTTEADETFHLLLSTPSGASIGDGDATATILNDDSAAPGDLVFRNSFESVAGQRQCGVPKMN